MPTLVTRPATRSLEGWAIATLREAGAIVECDEHGWMQERGDPHALARARDVARDDPPRGICSSEALAAIEEALAGIGDSCPDCSPSREPEELPRFK
ncbi:conserved hypothetical protein [Bradyrhizobium sp. ORS 375]|uniref:hypothetical protein n=1 Tax=Bradyrhizobium sp. (strain ORS 375) TaxID=566679 RepID=UPI00024063AA|nr:hypothetical protein [Bradyrhizobium sp. ORS 375]CCD94363.1 conserved hypothetical protein [Bradyrhizobium sp. ORS 375]